MNRTIQNALIALSCTIAMLFMGGCADDLRNRNLFDSGAVEAVISFSIEDVALTRGDDTQNMETIVDHAYLLFYNTSASLLNDAPIAAVKAEINTDQPGKLQFKMPLTLEAGKDYQMIAIANADSYVQEAYSDFKSYLEAWCSQPAGSLENPLHLYRASWISPTNHDNLPMNAGLTGDTKFRFTIDNGKYNVNASLSFRRMVARIDVANLVNDGFKIEGVSLCNWRNSIAISALNSEIGNRLGNICGVLSSTGEETENLQFIDMPDPDDNGNQQLTESLYCFPSVSSAASAGDSESTALIIKAKYGTDSQSSYYRVNVGMTGNHSQVKANTKYAVVIQSVKGPGASTPQEAYSSSAESPIVLSVVEDWDLEDGHFAMDDYGNFIVVSKGGPFTFESNSSENIVIRVLTSKGLNWDAQFVTDNEVPADGFNVSKVGDSAISIATKGVNEDEEDVTGVCRIFANTQQGGTLEVNIPLTQKGSEEKPYEPVEPTNLPFGLIPTSGERVKIDHENLTIEIDGFDPNCFNSFIDIPFEVYINKDKCDASSINISSNLQWPLEGRISTDKSLNLTYCQESFKTGIVLNNGNSSTINISESLPLESGKTLYISVGAMAPDDPAIVKQITLKANGESVKYTLTLKPCPVIIDDVILTDSSGNIWLIMDRNVQDVGNTSFNSFIGIDATGRKYQAYNYSYNYFYPLTIPNKYKPDGNQFNENLHDIYKGKYFALKDKGKVSSNSDNGYPKWIEKYTYSENFETTKKSSPFYENDNKSKWELPTADIFDLWKNNISVSKMRMYFVSEIQAKSEKTYIPICCYLPYYCDKMGDTSTETYGYFLSNDGIEAETIRIFSISSDAIEILTPKSLGSSSSSVGLIRLVRQLSKEELENYKSSYLGYGSEGLKLTPCHPDTYTSEGWLDK